MDFLFQSTSRLPCTFHTPKELTWLCSLVLLPREFWCRPEGPMPHPRGAANAGNLTSCGSRHSTHTALCSALLFCPASGTSCPMHHLGMPCVLGPNTVAPSKSKCVHCTCHYRKVPNGGPAHLHPSSPFVTSDNHLRLEETCVISTQLAQLLSACFPRTSISVASAWRFAMQITNHGDISPLGAKPKASFLGRVKGAGGIHFAVNFSAEEWQERGRRKWDHEYLEDTKNIDF